MFLLVSPRHEELAAVRGSEEERGCGVGGGERKGVGVALTRYRVRDPSVGRLFGKFVLSRCVKFEFCMNKPWAPCRHHGR